MKKSVSVLVIALFAINLLNAQTTEALTNSTIIKMVKAKLSDELIIDEINSSKVNFNMSTDSIKFLSYENVSDQVIQAMKAANGMQTSIVTKDSTIHINPVQPEESILPKEETPLQVAVILAKDTLKKSDNEKFKSGILPSQELSKEKIKTESGNIKPTEKSVITVDAISYVIPVEELMRFFDNEYTSLASVIEVWDQKIRDFLKSRDQIKQEIIFVEKELTDKKNADSKGFSNEIVMLKNKLTESRGNLKQWKTNMFEDGMNIVKEIKDIGNETDHSIDNNFNKVSQILSKTDANSSMSEIPKSITIPKQEINVDIVNYIAPVTEMLFCYQNEIISLKDIVLLWNEKAMVIIQKDSELSKQSEPLKKELGNYELNPKKNRKEISGLKKQCADIDKKRKQLAQQLASEGKELSRYLDQFCKEVQSSVKERFSDVIENINYSYLNNL